MDQEQTTSGAVGSVQGLAPLAVKQPMAVVATSVEELTARVSEYFSSQEQMWYSRLANKYCARKTIFSGRKYDSKHEAGVAGEIELLQKAGDVVKVEPQKTFDLSGKSGAKICGHRVDWLLTFKDSHKGVGGSERSFDAGLAAHAEALRGQLPDILYYVITPRARFYGSKKNLKGSYYFCC